MFCKKQYFRAIWKFAFSLAGHWAFIFCLRCHLTPIILIAAKQCWCHFEANECIFHLSLKIFRSFHQLTRNHQNRAFPNIWSTLYYNIVNVCSPKVHKISLIKVSLSFTISNLFPLIVGIFVGLDVLHCQSLK